MDNIIKKEYTRDAIANIIFYAGFSVYFITEWLHWITYSNSLLEHWDYYQKVLLVSAFFFIIKIVLTRYESKKEIMVMLLFLGLTLITYYFNKDIILVINTLIILSMKNVDLRIIFKIIIYFGLLITIMAFVYVLKNDMNRMLLAQNYGRGGLEQRFRLVWPHPNSVFQKLIIFLEAVLFLNYKKMKWWHYVFLYMVTYEIYQLTISRTGVICWLITITLFALLSAFENKLPERISMLFFLIMNVGCVGVSTFGLLLNRISEKAYSFLNKLLTGRLSLAKDAVKKMGITFFGQLENKDLLLDMGIVKIILITGVVMSLVYLVLIMGATYILCKNRKYDVMILLSCSLLYLVPEDGYIACFNALFYSIGIAFFLINFKKQQIKDSGRKIHEKIKEN